VIGSTGQVRVLVATRPVDFRKGADGLAALVRETMGADPFSGAIYVFRAKRADRVKLIFCDGTGVVLISKRLEEGECRWPKVQDGVIRLTAAEPSALLEGLDWRRVHGAKQTRHPDRHRPPEQPPRRTPALGLSDHARPHCRGLKTTLAKHGYVSDNHRKKPQGRPMNARTARGNGRRSKVRSAIEHVFARQKGPMGLFVRTIGIVRAKAKIGMANLAYNMTRYVWHEGRSLPA
jgi:transposase